LSIYLSFLLWLFFCIVRFGLLIPRPKITWNCVFVFFSCECIAICYGTEQHKCWIQRPSTTGAVDDVGGCEEFSRGNRISSRANFLTLRSKTDWRSNGRQPSLFFGFECRIFGRMRPPALVGGASVTERERHDLHGERKKVRGRKRETNDFRKWM